MQQQVENHENDHHESGLKHGQFYVNQECLEGKIIKVLIDPPSQEDIADGWNIVLPQANKYSTIHHFSVYLSQLPPHLWNKVKVNSERDDIYEEITDNIYKYSVKVSKHDDEIHKMYNLVLAKYPNIEDIRTQFKTLQNARVKGWIMIRAHKILYPPKSE